VPRIVAAAKTTRCTYPRLENRGFGTSSKASVNVIRKCLLDLVSSMFKKLVLCRGHRSVPRNTLHTLCKIEFHKVEFLRKPKNKLPDLSPDIVTLLLKFNSAINFFWFSQACVKKPALYQKFYFVSQKQKTSPTHATLQHYFVFL